MQNLSVVLLSTSVAKLYRKKLAVVARGTEGSGEYGETSGMGRRVAGDMAARVFYIAIALENIAVALLGFFIYSFLNGNSSSDGDGEVEGTLLQIDYCEHPFSSSYFCIAVFCGCIDAIFSSLLSMVISKEWVACLFYHYDIDDDDDDDDSKKNESSLSSKEKTQNQLAKANAFLSQIDLVIATGCPLLVSNLISSHGYHCTLIVMIAQHLFGAMIIIFCIKKAVLLQPKLAHIGDTATTNVLNTQDEKSKENEKYIQKKKFDDSNQHLSQEPKQNFSQSFPKIFTTLPLYTKLISSSYILLYFTILSPGAMLNSWMNSMNDDDSNDTPIVTEQTIAYFGSASQFCGAIATFITPFIIRRTKSLQKASAMTQWFQSICILYGFSCFYRLDALQEITIKGVTRTKNSSNSTSDTSLMIQFLTSIGLSRVGLWSFDLVERQVLQETVPRKHQTLFFNGEKSLTQFFSLGMMGLCYIYPNPQSFIVLVACSVVAVCLSSIIIAISLFYYKNMNGIKQKKE